VNDGRVDLEHLSFVEYTMPEVAFYNAALEEHMRTRREARSDTKRTARLSNWSLRLGLALALSIPIALPAASQEAAPVYGFTFTPEPPAAATPRILKIELNDNHLQAGQPIAILVLTTPDVTRVTTGNGRRAGTIPRISPGTFSTTSTLPHLGGIATIHLKLHFEATTADGTAVDVDVPVTYK
jgi:hypothetical protein